MDNKINIPVICPPIPIKYLFNKCFIDFKALRTLSSLSAGTSNNIPSSNNKRLIKLVEGMFPEKHRSKYWYTRGHVEPNESYKEAKQDLLKQIGGDNANN